MEIVSFRFPTAMRFGRGARRALAEFKSRFKVSRPLLVTDASMTQTEAFALVEEVMNQIWPKTWAVFDGVHPNPIEADAEQGFAAWKQHGADGIVALGGGSAIDGAKSILLKIAFPDRALSEAPLAVMPEFVAPLCAIPTTAGTGSEVGQSTVVVIPKFARKMCSAGRRSCRGWRSSTRS